MNTEYLKKLTILIIYLTLVSCFGLDEDHNACLDEVNKTYDNNDLSNKIKHMEKCMMEKGYVFTYDCDINTKSELLTKWCYQKSK